MTRAQRLLELAKTTRKSLQDIDDQNLPQEVEEEMGFVLLSEAAVKAFDILMEEVE